MFRDLIQPSTYALAEAAETPEDSGGSLRDIHAVIHSSISLLLASSLPQEAVPSIFKREFFNQYLAQPIKADTIQFFLNFLMLLMDDTAALESKSKKKAEFHQIKQRLLAPFDGSAGEAVLDDQLPTPSLSEKKKIDEKGKEEDDEEESKVMEKQEELQFEDIDDPGFLRRSAPEALGGGSGDQALKSSIPLLAGSQYRLPFSIGRLLLEMLIRVVVPVDSIPSAQYPGSVRWQPSPDVMRLWASILSLLCHADPAVGLS